MSKEKNLKGISGWLILVAIEVVVTPIQIGISIMKTYPQIFSTGAWEAMTTQGSLAYNPLWAPIIIGGLLIYCGITLIWIYLAYIFFTKNRKFPKWYIRINIFILVFIVVNAFAIKMVLPNKPIFDPDAIIELQRSVLLFIIWAYYMLVSKRVKATFIN